MSSTTAAEAAARAGPLNGRTALISGASRGIGLECARALHGAGARVVLLARSAEALDRAARGLGKHATPLRCDIGDAAALATVLSEIRTVLGAAPDIIVNNAGTFAPAPAERISAADFESTVRVNLVGHFTIVREFMPAMRARASGHIVTIGSIADRQAFSENAAYAASKYGARGLHEVLREELRGSGVRATLVSPGPVDTSLWDGVKTEARPGFARRGHMLQATAVADAVAWAVTRPQDVNIDELRLSRA